MTFTTSMTTDQTTTGGVAFRVHPEHLHAFAATIRDQGRALAESAGSLRAVAVDPGWFGKLPQSGHLADSYETHHQAALAGLTELARALQETAAAVDTTAQRYSAADASATAELEAIR